MVYHGRPSRNCLPCRRRKIRCDLNPIGCNQCRRAKLICHGYRNPKELAFRDETRITTQKAEARRASTPQFTTTPQLSWDILSRNAFLCLYIDRYSCGFNALAPLLAASPAAGHLQASVGAVGLAFMALQENRPDLMPLANRQYLAAIQAIREAIHLTQQLASNGTPQPVSDETLQSVLLLDLYEKLAIYHQWPGLPGSWLSHIQGALGMVQARPSADFRNPTTCQLASRTVIALTISCGAAGIPIPETLQAIRKDLDGYVRNAKWTFIGLLMSVVNLRAHMRSAVLGSDDILSRACELQDQLAFAESMISRSWRPHRVLINFHHTFIFDRYYDVYPSHYTVQVFNAFRILRLEMCGIIRNLHPCSLVAKTIAKITSDICAAVPQFILPGARPENTVPFSPLQILECRGILTALYEAAQITTDVLLRQWILQCLAYMADNGIKMARDVAHILTVTPEVDYWTVFAMVGSCGIIA
ncbi:hypothetical protein BKA56DRAFT_492223 [Ilyonectria sp. MPI-CAGE-AT-0026]|nr:hypothetical protein BKA56DRAFT_492223 [Ilyonectria sp. MPI-CAGE-AT-0026]